MLNVIREASLLGNRRATSTLRPVLSIGDPVGGTIKSPDTWFLDKANTSQFSVERWPDMKRSLPFAKLSTNPQGKHLTLQYVTTYDLCFAFALLFLNPCGECFGV